MKGNIIQVEFNKRKKLELIINPTMFYSLDFISKINKVEINKLIYICLQSSISDFLYISKEENKVNNFFLLKEFYWEFENENLIKECEIPSYTFTIPIDKKLKEKLGFFGKKFSNEEEILLFAFNYTIQSFLDCYNNRKNQISINFKNRNFLIQHYLTISNFYQTELDFLKKAKYIAGFTQYNPIICENKVELEKIISEH